MKCSVVLCTHNPRLDYLSYVLEALKLQTLSYLEWELLIIDNASTPPLSSFLDLSFQENARIVYEPRIGVINARIKGFSESQGDLIVFVDDDNVMAPDYLETACLIMNTNAQVGVWGGSSRGIFEIPPPEWAFPYLPGLALREISEDYFTDKKQWGPGSPLGAGMCIRKEVAKQYVKLAQECPYRSYLGRSGKGLSAGEDTDIAWCGLDMGYTNANFSALKFEHLIPARRLTESYLLALFAGFAYSGVILAFLHQLDTNVTFFELLKRPIRSWKQLLLKPKSEWQMEIKLRPISKKAKKEALDLIRQMR